MANNQFENIDNYNGPKATLNRYPRSKKILGIAQICIGILAILAPVMATLAFSVFLGSVLVILGFFSFIDAFLRESRGQRGSLIFGGALSLLVGVYMVMFVPAGALALTILLGSYFVVMSVLRFMEASQWPGGDQAWVYAGAVASLALGVLILAGLPLNAFWVVGLILGIQLVFAGFSKLGRRYDKRSGLVYQNQGEAQSRKGA